MNVVAPAAFAEPAPAGCEPVALGAGIMLLTGPRGSGKTSACRALVADVRVRGGSVAGLVCPACFREDVKVGIDVVELAGGSRRRLATRAGDDLSGRPEGARELTLGEWSFDPEALAWADEMLAAAPPACDLLVVDELGPLELLHGEGFTAALDLIDAGSSGLIVVVVRPDLLDVARRRWPAALVATPDTLAELAAALSWAPADAAASDRRAAAGPAVSIRDLSVMFAGRPALRHVSLDIAAGEFLLVSGPSGCGKSTLARVLAGLVPQVLPGVVKGTVRVDGADPVAAGPAATARHVGTVFQDPTSQLFCLTVDEELAFGPRNLGLDEKEVAARAEWAVTACSLGDLRTRAPATLSGGEQQRVATAAVLTMRPRVLVLDEPLSGLDVGGVRMLLGTLQRLNRVEGVTVVLIEHRLVEVARLADRLVLLEGGRLVADGAPAAVLDDRERARRLGLRRPTEEPFAEWEELLLPPEPRADREPALRATGISAGYGRSAVLRGVDLELYAGELVALVGENGSGKSTLARVLAGLKRPSAGSVTIPGVKRPRPGIDIGLLLQDPADQLLTDEVDAEVALGPRSWRRHDPAAHEELLTVSDLLELRRLPPLTLSAGQQQRTVLAAVLALRPRVIVLDEPTHGQDWGHLEGLVGFLRRLNEQGSAILLITHDFKLAHYCADRVAILRDGRIAATGVVAPRGARPSQAVAP